MPRRLSCLVALAVLIGSAQAAIWPDQLGKFERKSAQTVEVSPEDRAIADEYGLAAIESADYGSFQVTASQYKDTTGAYAASLEASRGTLLVGNYVVSCKGSCPKDLAAALAATLPHVSHAPLPILSGYLPTKSLISQSQRYILGPKGLGAFLPELPEAAVGFQFSPEAQIGKYRTPKGQQTLAIFAYPTLSMARQQAVEFQKLANTVVKRTGALVALVPAAVDQAAAEKLLSEINYQAQVAPNQSVPIPIKPQSVGQMLLAIFELCGIVLAFCVLSGLAFAGVRLLTNKFGNAGAQQVMVLLDLRDK